MFNSVGFWFIVRFFDMNFWNDKFVLYFEVFVLIISFFEKLIQNLFENNFDMISLGLGCCFKDFSGFSYFFPGLFWILG